MPSVYGRPAPGCRSFYACTSSFPSTKADPVALRRHRLSLSLAPVSDALRKCCRIISTIGSRCRCVTDCDCTPPSLYLPLPSLRNHQLLFRRATSSPRPHSPAPSRPRRPAQAQSAIISISSAIRRLPLRYPGRPLCVVAARFRIAHFRALSTLPAMATQQKWTGVGVRKTFFDFFEQKGHTVGTMSIAQTLLFLPVVYSLPSQCPPAPSFPTMIRLCSSPMPA